MSTHEPPRDASQEIGARGQSAGSRHDIECKQPGRGPYVGGVAEHNHAGPVRTLRKRDEAHTNRPDGRRENVSGEESDRQNHKAGHRAMKHNDVHVAKRTRNGVEEKKRETSPKPLNINAQNAWRCGDPGIRASRPRRDEIRKAKGMVRRIKEK